MSDKSNKLFAKQVARYHHARAGAEGGRVRALLAGEPQLATLASKDGLKTLETELKALKLERRALKKIEALAMKAAEATADRSADKGAGDKPTAEKPASAKSVPAKPTAAKPAAKPAPAARKPARKPVARAAAKPPKG